MFGDVAEQDLDVDLAIRGVDTSGIVDEIRVDASAREAELDACTLRQAEVAAFADNFAPQFIGIDSYIVIAAVSGIAVTFDRGFDVGADAAVP